MGTLYIEAECKAEKEKRHGIHWKLHLPSPYTSYPYHGGGGGVATRDTVPYIYIYMCVCVCSFSYYTYVRSSWNQKQPATIQSDPKETKN